MKDILYPIRKLHRRLYKEKMNVVNWKKINFPVGSKNFLIGTPLHNNIGDNAIIIAEKKVFE